MTREHELRTSPGHFQAALDNSAPQVVKEDRVFNIGDTVRLREWNTDMAVTGYTGRVLTATIARMIRGASNGVVTGYVVLGLRDVKRQPDDTTHQAADDAILGNLLELAREHGYCGQTDGLPAVFRKVYADLQDARQAREDARQEVMKLAYQVDNTRKERGTFERKLQRIAELLETIDGPAPRAD